MSFMKAIPSKFAIGALALGLMISFSGEKVEAATKVVEGGGVYDITADNFFFGNVTSSGGSGSYAVDFTSSTDPLDATANASVTVLVGTLFKDLMVSWVKTSTNAVLASEAIVSPLTQLRTTFGTPNLDQSLVFSWSDSQAEAGFDFDVSAVPLPAGGLLLLTALGGAAVLRRRRKPANA